MSEFWARKIRTYFSKIDVNSDGFISKKDAEAMADNLTDQAKSSPEQRAKTRNHYVEVTWFYWHFKYSIHCFKLRAFEGATQTRISHVA